MLPHPQSDAFVFELIRDDVVPEHQRERDDVPGRCQPQVPREGPLLTRLRHPGVHQYRLRIGVRPARADSRQKEQPGRERPVQMLYM